ncbi:hypothetical protein Mro03_68300 [Microbispora rosea subsp. rosea]|nr:hypothetical protein Mro03_68300 [Microbispora rosea subsp. rosea]
MAGSVSVVLEVPKSSGSFTRRTPQWLSSSTTSQPGSARLSTLKEMELVTGEGATKRRFLILYDYGMGGSWWWVRARSAREVLETFGR